MNAATIAAPSTPALLDQWHFEPSVVLGLIAFSGLYASFVGPWRRRYGWGPPLTRTQIVYFVLSDAVLIIALLSPLDTIGDTYLFSAHMVQHLLLATLWPPLLLLALPAWLARGLFRGPGSWIMGFFTYPAAAIGLFILDIYLWHLPQLYDLTLQNEQVHIVEHLSFMLFGIFNWWPILSASLSQRLAYPFQVLYLFVNMMFMMVLGIIFTFAPTVFYSPYVSAPRLWGISAATDQQIGGLIMWYPGNLAYFVLLVVAFYRWFDAAGPSPSETQRIQSQSPTIGPPAG